MNVYYLGIEIFERCIDIDRAKVEAIEKMACPRDIRGIHGFLVHVGFLEGLLNTSLKKLDLLLTF